MEVWIDIVEPVGGDNPCPDLTRHPYGVRVSNGWGELQTLGSYGTALWIWLMPRDKVLTMHDMRTNLNGRSSLLALRRNALFVAIV